MALVAYSFRKGTMAIRYGRQQDLEGVVFREPKLFPLKPEHYQACSCVAILTEASRLLCKKGMAITHSSPSQGVYSWTVAET